MIRVHDPLDDDEQAHEEQQRRHSISPRLVRARHVSREEDGRADERDRGRLVVERLRDEEAQDVAAITTRLIRITPGP